MKMTRNQIRQEILEACGCSGMEDMGSSIPGGLSSPDHGGTPVNIEDMSPQDILALGIAMGKSGFGGMMTSDIEPADVTDAWHPSEVHAQEDSWAGGDNIEDPLDHVRFETGESNAGPHVVYAGGEHGCDDRDDGHCSVCGAMSESLGISRQKLRNIISNDTLIFLNENEERISEMSEFVRSRGGKKVMAAGNKITSAAATIYEVADNHTGNMRRTLKGISEFVEKLGSSLSELGLIQEGESATSGLPTVQELRKLHKEIQKLEK